MPKKQKLGQRMIGREPVDRKDPRSVAVQFWLREDEFRRLAHAVIDMRDRGVATQAEAVRCIVLDYLDSLSGA